MKTKRITATLLVIAALLTASCNNNSTEKVPESSASGAPDLPQTISLENYYASEKLGIDFEAAGYKYDYANGRIYYSKTTEIRDMESRGELIGRNVEIFSCDTNGGDERLEWSRELPVTGDTKTGSIQLLEQFGADESGNLWVITSTTEFDTESETTTYELVESGVDGSDLSVGLSQIENIGALPVGLLFDGSGNVYIETSLSSGRALFVYSGTTGEYLSDTRNDENYRSAATANDGNVVYQRISEGGYEFVTLGSSGIVSVSQGLTATISGGICNGAGDYGIFYYDNDSVYGLNLETMETTPIINLTNSEISVREIMGLNCLSVTEFLILRNVGTSAPQYEIHRLTYDPDAVVRDKIQLTLGFAGYNRNITEYIRIFNSTSQASRIELVTYDNYTQLDMDILAGNAPDILYIDANLSPDKYIAKGLFADLTDYLENDPRVNREDLFPNILEMGSKDGRLYHIIPEFSLSTLVGKASIFGENGSLTTEKLRNVIEAYPDAEIIADWGREYWLANSLFTIDSDYIDWENATCSFNSEQFIEALELMKLFPDTSTPRQDMEFYAAELIKRFREDRALLYNAEVSHVRAARNMTDGFGEEVSFVGYPFNNGTGHHVLAQNDFAIMESSEHKNEAWEFISMFLRENTEMPKAGISINRRVIEAEAKAEMIPFTLRDFSKTLLVKGPMDGPVGGTFYVESPEEVNLEDFANYHLTEEDVAMQLDLIESATMLTTYGAGIIYSIVLEEVEPYLTGNRTAKETAKIIQSRVSLYVTESA